MDARLTDEQQQFADVASRLASAAAHPHPGPPPSDDDRTRLWTRLLDVGVPRFALPATIGLEAAGVEQVLVLEALGHTLATVPALSQAVIVPQLLVAAGALDVYESVCAGTRRLSVGWTPTLGEVAQLGETGVVLEGDGCVEALVVVRDGDTRRVCVAQLGEPLDRALDLTRAAFALPADPAHEELGTIPAERWPGIEAIGLAGVGADLVGVAQGALDEAVAHVREREQFGTAVGSFQAVQHLAADAHVQLEGARSLVRYAGWAVDRLAPEEMLQAARVAKADASRAARLVVETAVQLRGGLGITWESRDHLRLRRVLTDRVLWGDDHELLGHVAANRLRWASQSLADAEAGARP